MTKILIAVVALTTFIQPAAAPSLQQDTATTQGFCNMLPWLPFCAAWR